MFKFANLHDFTVVFNISAHEITHAFDDSGILFDQSGANKPLYDEDTVERYYIFRN